MDFHIHVLPVVQARTLQTLIIYIESQRFNQMQSCTGCCTGTGNVSGVRRDFRFYKNDM
jgi:hypothetical protein